MNEETTENAVKQQSNSKRVIGKPFPKGVSGNPAGRPKGQSMKEYDREKFSKMTPEEREEFLKTVSPEVRYKMAEGNPHQATDITSGGKSFIPTSEEKAKIVTALDNIDGSSQEDTE